MTNVHGNETPFSETPAKLQPFRLVRAVSCDEETLHLSVYSPSLLLTHLQGNHHKLSLKVRSTSWQKHQERDVFRWSNENEEHNAIPNRSLLKWTSKNTACLVCVRACVRVVCVC